MAEVLNEFHGWDCIGFLGIRAEIVRNCAVVSLSPETHHLGGHSGGRWVNGPTILSMCDASMALVALAHVAPAKVATVSVNVNFLKGIPDRTVFCAAHAVQASGRLVQCRAVIFADNGVPYANATGILAVISSRSLATG